jgi:hypothetical protein
MNHDELINNWISMDKAAVDIGLTAEAMSAMSEEITRLRQRAEAAEAERELAGRATDTYVENMGTAIRITVGSLTSLYAERRKSGGAKVYIQVGNSFMGLDLGEYAAAAFADWLQPRA